MIFWMPWHMPFRTGHTTGQDQFESIDKSLRHGSNKTRNMPRLIKRISDSNQFEMFCSRDSPTRQLSIPKKSQLQKIAAFSIAKCKIAGFATEISKKSRKSQKNRSDFWVRNKNRSVSAFPRSQRFGTLSTARELKVPELGWQRGVGRQAAQMDLLELKQISPFEHRWGVPRTCENT